MKIKQMTITPDKARELLKGNTSNRKVRNAQVDYLACEISNGRFLLTSETIKITSDGMLIDGQHRLLACIQANKPIELMVETDADPKSQDVIDSGAKRSVADQLHMNDGLQDANLTVAAIRSICSFCCFHQNIRLSVGMARDLTKTFSNQTEVTIGLLQPFRPARKSWVVGVLAFALRSEPKLKAFIEQFGSGVGLRTGDPAKAARDWFTNGSSVSLIKARTYKRSAIEGLFNVAYNALNGNSITMVKKGSNGMDYFIQKERKLVGELRAEFRQQLESLGS